MKFGVFAVLCFSAVFATGRADDQSSVKQVVCEGVAVLSTMLGQWADVFPSMQVFTCPLYKSTDRYCNPDQCSLSCSCTDTNTTDENTEVTTALTGQSDVTPGSKSKALQKNKHSAKSKSNLMKSKHAKSKHHGKSKNAKSKQQSTNHN